MNLIPHFGGFDAVPKIPKGVCLRKLSSKKGKDVCDILEIGNTGQAVSYLCEDEKNTITINEGIRGNPTQTIISESGLCSLIL